MKTLLYIFVISGTKLYWPQSSAQQNLQYICLTS